jgi:hypothetical protein
VLTLGERESGTARLEEAAAAYRAALTERTRERVPLDWAMTTGNLGVAHMVLAERTGNARMAQTALFRSFDYFVMFVVGEAKTNEPFLKEPIRCFLQHRDPPSVYLN